jgi:hypothetical protein
MSGNTNASLLANAHAQAVQNLANSNPTTNANNSTHLYQPRVCAECWTYWKKFASFKFPNARQERLNQLKNQIHKCSVNGCGRVSLTPFLFYIEIIKIFLLNIHSLNKLNEKKGI